MQMQQLTSSFSRLFSSPSSASTQEKSNSALPAQIRLETKIYLRQLITQKTLTRSAKTEELAVADCQDILENFYANIESVDHYELEQAGFQKTWFFDNEAKNKMVKLMSLFKDDIVHYEQTVEAKKNEWLDNAKENHGQLTLGSLSDEQAIWLAEFLATSPEQIYSLNLSNNRIDGKTAEALANALKTNTVLTTLNLSDTHMGKAGITALADALKINRTLSNLNLSSNKFYNRDIWVLVEALKINTTLKKLDLSETLNLSYKTSGEEGGKVFAEIIKTNIGLTTLCLNDNSMEDQGANEISQALKYNTSLKILDLSSNSLEELEKLSDALQKNTTLTTLKLRMNSFEVTKDLAAALKVNKTLANLDLSYNDIDADSIKDLAAALKVNKTLTNLNLSNNKIYTNDDRKFSSQGIAAIASAVRVNTVLATLDLSHNELKTEGAEFLAEELKFNRTLTTLDLSHNDIDNDGACAFAGAFTSNTTLLSLKLNNNKSINNQLLLRDHYDKPKLVDRSVWFGENSALQQLKSKTWWRDSIYITGKNISYGFYDTGHMALTHIDDCLKKNCSAYLMRADLALDLIGGAVHQSWLPAELRILLIEHISRDIPTLHNLGTLYPEVKSN